MRIEYKDLCIRNAERKDCEQQGFKKIRINIDSWQDQLGNLQSSLDYELLEEDFVDYRQENVKCV